MCRASLIGSSGIYEYLEANLILDLSNLDFIQFDQIQVGANL